MPTIRQRAVIAADPVTPVEVLVELSSDKAPSVRAGVAANPSAPSEVLRRLVEDKDWRPRLGVVLDNTSPAAIAVALGSKNVEARTYLSNRRDLDDATVDALSADESHRVRAWLAWQTNSLTALLRLSNDPHPDVRASAVINPLLPLDELERLARDRRFEVRAQAATSRRLSEESLIRLAQDGSTSVRWSVLVSHPERLAIARIVARDSDKMNAGQAKAQLRDPKSFTEYLGKIDIIE